MVQYPPKPRCCGLRYDVSLQLSLLGGIQQATNQRGRKQKNLRGKLGKKATPKRLWIRPIYSASVAFSRQEDKNEEIIIIKPA